MTYQKKSYKKFVATAASATLVASAIVPVVSASFPDVEEKHEFATYINKAVEAGYIKGYADGTFGINDNLKRSQVVIIIGRYLEKLGYTSKATTSPWSDVKDEEVIKYGNIVKDAKVFTGYEDGTLNGGGFITRENMAVVLDRLAKTVTDGTSFSDVAKDIEDEKIADLATANADYQASIQALRDLEISTVDNFNPKGNVKRGQFAKFIINAIEKIDAIAQVTAEDIAKEIAAVDATLPAVADINADNAEAAKAAVEAAKTAIAAIEAKIAEAEFTTEEVAELEKEIAAVEAKYDAILEAADKAIGATVESVSATNGKVTVKLTKAPTAVPAVTDFKVTQNINGKTTAINASSVEWNAATSTAVLSVPTIYANEVDQNVSYSVGYQETAAQTSATFLVAKVTELKVESVTALNSKQIQVVYNQEVDKATAETLANYTLTSDPHAENPKYSSFADKAAPATAAKLQDDKKTVVITLGDTETIAGTTAGVLDNKTALGLKIKATAVKSVTGKVLEKDAKVTFQLNDTTAPTVSKVEVAENGDLVVTFNEQVKEDEGKVTVNGYSYYLDDVEVEHKKGVSKATITKADLIHADKAKLETGKTYPVAVSSQEDVYGNVAETVYTSSLTYSATAQAPTLKSVTAVDEKSFILEFSENLTKVDGNTLTVQVNKGAQQLETTKTVTDFEGRKDGQYKVVLTGDDLENDVVYDRAKNETTVNLTVYIPGVKDAAGNITAATSTTVALSKDVTKPAVEKSTSTGTRLDVKLTEEVTAITEAKLAAGSYVLAENGRQIPVVAAGFTPIADGKKDFTFTYAKGVTGGLTEGNYTLVVKKDTLVDQSLNGGNKNDEIRIPFAVGADLQVKPEVKGVNATTKAGEIVVEFSAPVTYASVANYQNYQIDGVNIPSASTFVLDSTGKKLTITLPEGTYKTTGDRVITINGARNLAGTVMAQYQAVTHVSENEKIKLQSAKVVDGEIILTFNEDVNNTTLNVDFDEKDFLVKVEGTAVKLVAGNIAEADKVNDVTKLAKNQIKITAPAGVSYGTGTITVEVVNNDTLATDKAGNTILVNGTVITATR